MSDLAEVQAASLAGPVSQLARRASAVVANLRDNVRAARSSERREPTFTIGEAADLVGRTPAAIRDAEKDGRLPPPPRTESNRRVGYTLAQVNDMRGVFGTRPWRGQAIPARSSPYRISRAASASPPYRSTWRSTWPSTATGSP